MRIWDIPPSKLCKNHLLGEHRELHAMWTVITVPLGDGNTLFISINNEPPSKTKTKSYGHLAEMGKILSIVEFIKSKK